MSTIVNLFLSGLREIAQRLNPDIFKAYPEDQAITIWTEGGEWPAYSECYESYDPSDDFRDFHTVPYTTAMAIEDAVSAVENHFGNHREAAISMDCGLGKSTVLVRALHTLKYGRRTIVIEPSSLVAASLVKYLDSYDVKYVQSESHMSAQRGIYYMSAGVFVHMTLTGHIYDSDLIIIDESHTCSLTYDVMKELLSRTSHRLILMTASTTDQVKTLRSVRVIDVSMSRDHDPMREVVECGEHLIVGVNDDMSYAAPANAFVGATLPELRAVYDTALRPQPRVHNDVLIPGERVATHSEVVQMLGRVGRTQRGGVVYYNSKPFAMRDQCGVALYDVLRKAIRVYLKLDKGDRDLAMCIWINSGMSGKRDAPASITPDASIAGDPDPHTQSSPSDKTESNVERVVTHASSSLGTSYLTTVTNARPFMRANTDHVTPLRVNDASLRRYWSGIISAMNYGDSVFPEPLHIDTTSQVDNMMQEECRLIVSGRMLPDFSEREMLGVIAVWNKYVRSLRNRPADLNRLSMFVKYFSEAYSFDEYRFK